MKLGEPLDASRPSPAPVEQAAARTESGKIGERASAPPAEPAAAPPPAALALAPPFDIIDGRAFSSGRWTIVLFGVSGPEREAVCLDRDQRMFACGLAARAALNNALRQGKVACEVKSALDGDRLMAECRAQGGDVALSLMRNGWLKPEGDGSSEQQDAVRQAREGGRGLWNGGWRLR